MADRLALSLYGPQAEVWEALRERMVFALLWGRGTGKSHFLWLLALLLVAKHDHQIREGARQQRGVRIIFLLPTVKQFKDIFADMIQRDLAGEWAFLGGKLDRTTWTIKFRGGSWIKPFPAAEHTSRAARGQRCDVVLLDETDDIPTSVYHGVTVPWFSEPFSLGMCVAAGTPRKGRRGLLSKLYDLGLDPEQDGHLASFATYVDVPELVDADTVAKAKATMPPSVFAREWEANRDAAEGLVYDLFDERFHIQSPPEDAQFSRVIVGVDWGYVDPGVMAVLGIIGHGQDAQAYQIEEHYIPGEVSSFWVDRAKEIAGRYNRRELAFYCDSSRPDTIKDLRHKAQVNATPATHKVEDGVACMADKLQKFGTGDDEWSRLYVSRECKNTIREFSEYRRKRDPQDPDRYLEEIDKKNDHAMDAIRYALFAQFGKPPSTRTEWTGSYQ